MPAGACVVLAASWGRELPAPATVALALLLAGSVLAAVHHAEVVADRVGEPLGALVLAVAVTVIEVALVVTLMVGGDEAKAATLARDTVFAAVMITCNGIVGLCLVVGARRDADASFNAQGTGAAVTVVITLATLSLVLPTFTTSRPGPEFSASQLGFAALASVVLYGVFVVLQTGSDRHHFLPVGAGGAPDASDGHQPTAGAAGLSLGLLIVALVAVVGLAKTVSSTVERGVEAAGFPPSAVGVVIALLVLLPETVAAVRAARSGRLQTGLNLAHGSAMASIGLTIPAIALATIWLPGPLLLGLGATGMGLLALTAVVSVLTVVSGRVSLVQGSVHLAIFAGFVFLALHP